MTFRWGLIGHGYISGQFLEAVEAIDGAEVVAVMGRDLDRTGAFAEARGLVAATSVGELREIGVDAAYVCTPHTAHLDPAVECLRSGIPVLVEKPMTPTASDTARLVAEARSTGVFAMEAVWTRFLPIYDVVRGWIADGRIGEIQLITASFGFAAPADPSHRLFDPERAGGSILDVGIYPLTVAEMVTGAEADELRATGIVGSTGVDEHVVVAARYGSVVAQLSSALRANLDLGARIQGTEGIIEIPFFFAASEATLISGDDRETEARPHPANGFEYEIQHVMQRVSAGRSESDVMPFAVSLRMAEQCDELRRQVGLRYPFEKDRE